MNEQAASHAEEASNSAARPSRPTRVRLQSLELRNVGAIDEAALDISDGFTAITGETGTGKTLLLTAAGLVRGDRAKSTLVGPFADVATVDAIITRDDVEVLLQREVRAEGASKARIDGRLASVSSIQELTGDTVHIIGQGAALAALTDVAARQAVDRHVGLSHEQRVADHGSLVAKIAALTEEREQLEQANRDAQANAEQRRHAKARLDAFGPTDADHHLDERIDAIQNIEETREALQQATAAADKAADAAARAAAALARVATTPTDLTDAAQSLAATSREVARDVGAFTAEAAFPDEDINDLMQRKHDLRQLLSAYGPSLDDLFAFYAALDENGADGPDKRLAACRAALAATETQRERLASEISEAREHAAADLSLEATAMLRDLAMPHATLRLRRHDADVGPSGADRIVVELDSGAGQFNSVRDTASGGERSRIALVMHVLFADVTDAQVLVFDEVDAGVGGRAATAVGALLHRLARDRQVLCVTHLAQVAVFADQHVVVTRLEVDGQLATSLGPVDDAARVDEVARLLSGQTHDEARSHAQKLLGEAQQTAAAL